MNVRALHGDMTQGSRDGVMLAFKGGRVPILVATDVAARGPGHLDRHARDQLRRADLARHLRAPHRAHRPRRALGRAITFVEDRQKRELEAIERHIGTPIAPVGAGRRRRRRRRCSERPRRHSKPRISRRRRRSPTSSWCSAAGAPPGWRGRHRRRGDLLGRPRRRGGARRAGARPLLVPVGARARGRPRDRGARRARRCAGSELELQRARLERRAGYR